MHQEPDPLAGFPRRLTLEDGATVQVRPLQRGDEQRLLQFFSSIPEQERFWLREDVTDPTVLRRWTEDLDYGRVLPLIAEHADDIVADATLHRRGFGARHYLGEIRLVVSPAYRGRGLGYALIAELIDIAQAAGLERLEAEIVAEAQTAALEAIAQIGFEQIAVLPGHLRGPDGRHYDLMILVYTLQE